jgi:hypothetical protein
MPTAPQAFADLLGARIVGEVPDVGGGLFGMARLARLMHERLTPSRGERPGRPTDAIWASRPKVPMSEATQRRLAAIAAALSTDKRRVSPMQVAAQLLEEAVFQVQLPAPDGTQADAPNEAGCQAKRPSKTKRRAEQRQARTRHQEH